MRRRPAGVIKSRVLPTWNIVLGIKSDIGFGETEVGVWRLGVLVGRMNRGFPASVTQPWLSIHHSIKHQRSLATAVMAETMLAKIPQ